MKKKVFMKSMSRLVFLGLMVGALPTSLFSFDPDEKKPEKTFVETKKEESNDGGGGGGPQETEKPPKDDVKKAIEDIEASVKILKQQCLDSGTGGTR